MSYPITNAQIDRGKRTGERISRQRDADRDQTVFWRAQVLFS